MNPAKRKWLARLELAKQQEAKVETTVPEVKEELKVEVPEVVEPQPVAVEEVVAPTPTTTRKKKSV